MTGTRWPELEDSLRVRGFVQMLCLAAAVALLLSVPRIDSDPLQLAAVAGVGALSGVVVGGVLDVWFYVRPAAVRFEERGDDPSIVVGLVSQAAQVLLGISVAVAAVGLAWQFGDEQMSLTKHGRGPFAPVSLFAVGLGALVLWSRVATWPGRRPELVITARGISELRTGTPFTIGWSAIRDVREENRPGSFWGRERRANFIALETNVGVVLTLQAQHLKPSAYDVFELLHALHGTPELRARMGRVSSVAELLTPLEGDEHPPSFEELAFSQPGQRRAVIAGIVIAAIAVPFAVDRAGDTPLIAERPSSAGSDPLDGGGTNATAPPGPPNGGFSAELRVPTYDPSVNCRDLLESRPVLNRVSKGLSSVRSDGRAMSKVAVPTSQQILNTSGVLTNYARAHLHGDEEARWRGYGDALARAAQDVWYSENSDADPPDVWLLVRDLEPELLTMSDAARAAIGAECVLSTA